MDDSISRQAAIELFKDDIAAVNELNNLPSQPDRMKYVQESVYTIMNTCKSDSIEDKAFRNAARLIQNAIDGKAPDFEAIEELPSTLPEIIRCKDCKHWIPYDWMFSEVWQSKNMTDYPEDEIGCEYCDSHMTSNDFCSKAERRNHE